MKTIFPFDLHFNWPVGVYLSLFVFLFIVLYAALFHTQKQKRRLFLASLIVPPSRYINWLKVFFLSACWLASMLAVMQPLGNGTYLEGQTHSKSTIETPSLKRKAHDVLLLIDASASMGIKDSRLGLSRLEYGKEIADQIIGNLTGESAAIYAFTSQIDELSPLTLDAFFLRMMLQQIGINQGGQSGTNLFEALSEIKKIYFETPSPKLKTLILISDGGDTTIEALQGAEQKKAIEALAVLVEGSQALHLRVFTIGMGSVKGGMVPGVTAFGKDVHSSLESAPLEALAKSGRGNYYEANRYSSLELAEEVHRQMLQDPPYYDENEGLTANSLAKAVVGDSNIIYKHYFQYPLSAAIILLLLALIWPTSAFWNRSKATKTTLLLLAFNLSLPAQSALSGDENQNEIQIAKAYWDGPAYEKSLAIYRKLQNTILTPDQKSSLIYNIGTTYLAQNEFNAAIQHFNSIPQTASPLVRDKAEHNLAIAYVRLALKLQNDKHPTEESQEYGILFYHFEQALAALKKSLAARCEWQTFINTPCSQPTSQLQLQKEIEKQLAILRQKAALEQNRQLSPENNLLRLEKELGKIGEMIAFMRLPTLNSSQQTKYLNLFATSQNEWLPIWTEIQQKMTDAPAKNAVSLAHKHYVAMQKAFNARKWPASELALKETATALETAIQTYFGNTLLRKRIEQLYLAFRSAAATTLNQESAKQLDIAFQQVHQLTETGSAQEKSLLISIQNALDTSQQQLTLAIAAFKASDTNYGALSLENGAEWTREALSQLTPPSPTELLKSIISAQDLCIRLCSLEETKTNTSSLTAQAKALQSLILNRAKTFIPTVYQQQLQNYLKGLCQASPWQTTLPLFEEGKKSAAAALSLLKEFPITQSIPLQQQALKTWKKTLSEIANPSPLKTNGCHTETEKKPHTETDMTQALQLLQTMEIDDHLPTPSPKTIETSKPW